MNAEEKYKMALNTVQNRAIDVRKWQRNRGFNDRTELMNAVDNAEAGYRNKNISQIEDALETFESHKDDLHPTEKDVIGGYFRQVSYTLGLVDDVKE